MIHEQRVNSNVRRRHNGLRHEAHIGADEHTGKGNRQYDQSPEIGRRLCGSSSQTQRRWRGLDSSTDSNLHSVLNDIRAVCHGILRHSGNGRKNQGRHSQLSGFWSEWLEKSRGLRSPSRGASGDACDPWVLFRQFTS